MVKEWRNNEAHVSPTASEQEIDAAINIIITMYFFATGSCITELESNGHDIEKERKTEPVAPGKPKRYVLNKEATTMFDNDAKMAADSLSVEERF